MIFISTLVTTLWNLVATRYPNALVAIFRETTIKLHTTHYVLSAEPTSTEVRKLLPATKTVTKKEVQLPIYYCHTTVSMTFIGGFHLSSKSKQLVEFDTSHCKRCQHDMRNDFILATQNELLLQYTERTYIRFRVPTLVSSSPTN